MKSRSRPPGVLGADQARRRSRVVGVSNLVVFLASDESGFVTGTEYTIDGGSTAL